VEVIQSTNHKKIDRDTAVFLNAVTNLALEFEEKEGAIDMCKAINIKKSVLYLKQTARKYAEAQIPFILR
jgi:hypothetical protein